MGSQSSHEHYSLHHHTSSSHSFDHSLLVFHTTGTPQSKYLIKRILGKGSYGTVSLVEHKLTHKEYALKELLKSGLSSEDRENMMREVNILSTVDHPNIMSIYEVIESNVAYNIVTEYLPGGELLELICKQKRLSENAAAKYMHDVMSAIKYCHSIGITHRDLKPQNLMLTSNDSDAFIKVIDFGLSGTHDPDSEYTDIIGTPLFMGPEVFSGRYSDKCDIWSAGVILYMMITGLVPFPGKDLKQVRKSVCTREIDFSKPVWEKVSKDVKDLLTKMLEKNPAKRYNVSEVIDHRWFHHYHNENLSDTPICAEALNNLSKFHADTKLKLTILNYIGTRIMDQQSAAQLSCLFKAIDKNNDGKLSYEEITSAYQRLGITLEDPRRLFSEIDSDESGMVEYNEFITGCQKLKDLENRGDLERAFQHYDVEGHGTLSLFELQASVPGIESQEWVEFFNAADKDKDGHISLTEFKDFMLSHS